MLLKIVYVLVRRLLSLAVLVFREDLSRSKIGFGWRDRADVDVELVNKMLVGPVLARMGSGATAGLDPEETSRRITDLVFDGIRAC